MSCRICIQSLACCHEPVVEHADGVAACADPTCELPVGLHEWWVACVELVPTCSCVPDEAHATVLPLAA